MRSLVWTVALAACGSGSGAMSMAPVDAGAPTPEAGVASEAGVAARDAAVPLCTPATTRACTCDPGDTSGRQTCLGSRWGQCVCQTSGAATPRCKAGYYVGQLEGEYWSGAFDFLGTGQSWIPLPVRGVDQGERPGFAFTIYEETVPLGQEFSTYTIGNGCLIGVTETPLFGTHPTFGVIRGELDCETGYFDGTLEGEYHINGDPSTAFRFEGPVTGEFLPASSSFESGTWDVVEHRMNDAPPGGSGTWSATRRGDVDSAPPLPDECASLR